MYHHHEIRRNSMLIVSVRNTPATKKPYDKTPPPQNESPPSKKLTYTAYNYPKFCGRTLTLFLSSLFDTVSVSNKNGRNTENVCKNSAYSKLRKYDIEKGVLWQRVCREGFMGKFVCTLIVFCSRRIAEKAGIG